MATVCALGGMLLHIAIVVEGGRRLASPGVNKVFATFYPSAFPSLLANGSGGFGIPGGAAAASVSGKRIDLEDKC